MMRGEVQQWGSSREWGDAAGAIGPPCGLPLMGKGFIIETSNGASLEEACQEACLWLILDLNSPGCFAFCGWGYAVKSLHIPCIVCV